MIRFACPRCKTVLERPDNEAGGKFSCPDCQQRLQVPLPAENKTVLGNLVMPIQPMSLDRSADSAPASPVIGAARIRIIDGREHVLWHCPLCQNEVKVALDLGQTTVRCPHCAKKIQVPSGPQQHFPPAHGIQAQPAPATPVVPPPLPPPASRPVTTIPVARDSWDDPNVDDVQRRPRRRDNYDDDDRPVRKRRRPDYGADDCARAANVGFLCSLISLGLIFAAMVLWFVLMAEQPRGREANPFVFIIIFIGLGSFILGLIGTIFSSRGLDPINERNRGLAISGLVCGILGMVVGLIGSIVFFCIGMFLLAIPWR